MDKNSLSHTKRIKEISRARNSCIKKYVAYPLENVYELNLTLILILLKYEA